MLQVHDKCTTSRLRVWFYRAMGSLLPAVRYMLLLCAVAAAALGLAAEVPPSAAPSQAASAHSMPQEPAYVRRGGSSLAPAPSPVAAGLLMVRSQGTVQRCF